MKQVVVMIETDHPNADGITRAAAEELFRRFTRRPRFTTKVAVLRDAGDGAEPFGAVLEQAGI